MSIDNLEKELQEKQKKYNKNIMNTIRDTFTLWVSEISNTVIYLFETPDKWRNQITHELENFEEEVILERKSETTDD